LTQQFQVKGSDGKTYCTLADNSITAAMLASPAAIRDAKAITAPTSFTTSTTATWETVCTTPAVTVPANSNVWVISAVSLIYFAGSGSNVVYLRIMRDATAAEIYKNRWDVGFVGQAGTTQWPLPMLVAYDNTAPAGSHTYTLQVFRSNSVGSVLTPADAPGILSAWVFA